MAQSATTPTVADAINDDCEKCLTKISNLAVAGLQEMRPVRALA